ncbi:MAG: type VI secretion system contractile sheath small subunit [Gammaproteobacteria bacterium]
MADNGSVAPKERVNIVYKPAIGDAKEEIELPLKVLVLGDFTQAEDERPVEDRKPIDINKNNFNEVMASQNLSVEMSVENKIDENGGDMPVSLKFESIKDFDPEQIARQIPDLQQILELRQALMALKGPLGNVPGMRKAIQGMLEDTDSRDKLKKELGIDG